jgi:hypothetical protein
MDIAVEYVIVPRKHLYWVEAVDRDGSRRAIEAFYFVVAKFWPNFGSSSWSATAFCIQSRVSGADNLSSNPNDSGFISPAVRTDWPNAAIKRRRSMSVSISMSSPRSCEPRTPTFI